MDARLNGNTNERQRIFTETGRLSFSSSCSSSVSSSDFYRGAQPEASSVDHINFTETRSEMSPSNSFNRSGQPSFDLRDVVKDSMYREARGLSTKTRRAEETVIHMPKKREDSPRTFQLKYVSRKQNTPEGLKDSLRNVTKIRESPQNHYNVKEVPRSSYASRERSLDSVMKEAPRFSVDSRDMNKTTQMLKELPRLSLDSRERVVHGSDSYPRMNKLSKSLSSGSSNIKVSNIPQSTKRPLSVVAKLMGLETLPGSPVARDTQSSASKFKYFEDNDPYSRSLGEYTILRPVRASSSSPRSSMRDPLSPRLKSPDFVMRPSNSKFPVESAPWKHMDRNRTPSRPTSRQVKVPSRVTASFPSVYSEIEKKLKDIEFTRSGKDLRALKQILDAIHAKSFLEIQKNTYSTNFGSQNAYGPGSVMADKKNSDHGVFPNDDNIPRANQVSTPPGMFESPIVIMKPAKLVEKAGIPASSLIPIHSLSRLNRHSGHEATESKSSAKSNAAKDRSPRRNLCNISNGSTGNKNVKSSQVSRESDSIPVKNLGSVSPRLQQNKLELDKRSQPPPPCDSIKPMRQTKKIGESACSGSRRRMKAHRSNKNEDHLSQQSNDSRSSSQVEDDASLQSETSIVMDSKMDMEVTRGQPIKVNISQSQFEEFAESLDPTLVQKDLSQKSKEDRSSTATSKVGRDQPSPVSVLDALMLKEVTSPMKSDTDICEGKMSEENCGGRWNPAYSFSENTTSGLSSEINRKKLRNVDHLVQKLRRLNSTHDEASQDYIASLCENTNPDHRYISEILLASGLLLRDLGSGLSTFQLHPSGHPINPEMFLVLEQTKGHNLRSEMSHSGTQNEKLHRRLLFDVVNEILLEKLASAKEVGEPWWKSNKIVRKTLTAQKLLKELCSEVESLHMKKPESFGLEEEEDIMKSILWEDVTNRSGNWREYDGEISGVVLDVERSVFKDLVNEVIHGEATGLRTRPCRRRVLFTAQ